MFMNDESRIMRDYFIILIVLFSTLPCMSLGEENWASKAEMPTARYGLTVSAVNGKIYAIGGRRSGQFFSTVEVYDPVMDTWTNATNMPTARVVLSSSVVNGRIYAIGGSRGAGFGPTTIVEEYDPATDTWTRKTDMPTERFGLSTSVVNGKIYAFGGNPVGVPWGSPILEEYDPVTDTWTRKASMPTPRVGQSTSAVGGKIYVIGGTTARPGFENLGTEGGMSLSTVEEYDPATDTWTRKSDMPTARDGLSTTVVNDKIYAIGGNGDYSGMDISNALLSTVEAYDPATDTWEALQNMPTPRSSLSVCSVHRTIYAIGGQSGRWPAVTGAVEAYSAGPWGFAGSPNPADGALHLDTWVTLNWTVGDFAVSHDVYFSDNFEDVSAGTDDAFMGNQTSNIFFAGFTGYPYPDGLVSGTTYYWRVDEVNDSHPESPWKGPVWSFSIPPRKAYGPDPADGAESVDLNVELGWSAGLDAILHTVYFGENFEDVNNPTGGAEQATTTYASGPLKPAKTYYWRVDELVDARGGQTYKGDIWSFTTVGVVVESNPANGAVDVEPTQILSWTPGYNSASHEVYFGTDAGAVKNTTKNSPEYKGTKALGNESYDPGMLALETMYYWRIDEVNSVHPDSPWKGPVWNFTTGNFISIDDFEDYDAGENRIWYAWHDGLGYLTNDNGTYPGNGTGSMVGDENTNSYTEETIVHGGSQSMPVSYDNNQLGKLMYSEVEKVLTFPRDWMEEGVGVLSLWFRGYSASVGSFTEGPAGTYTITGAGVTLPGSTSEELHFAYQVLSGVGSIVARIDSLQYTHPQARTGVMIREKLSPDSVYAFGRINADPAFATEGRSSTGSTGFITYQRGAVPPHWVKVERSIIGNIAVSHSTDGSNWEFVPNPMPVNIPLNTDVCAGLAVSSQCSGYPCEAVFSNVTFTGDVSSQWMNEDIGILSNDPEPLYVAIANESGTPAVVYHEDPNVVTTDTWTEWNINLSKFSDQGIDLTDVGRIAIGLGTQGNVTIPDGKGKMYFDDIRLHR